MTEPTAPTADQGTATGKALRPLKARADYLRVAGTRLRWATPGIVVQAARAKPGNEATIGFGLTASKKVGKAVDRNRAKRRLRHLARDVLTRRGQPGVDYVLICRAATVTRPFANLTSDLEQALDRLERKVR